MTYYARFYLTSKTNRYLKITNLSQTIEGVFKFGKFYPRKSCRILRKYSISTKQWIFSIFRFVETVLQFFVIPILSTKQFVSQVHNKITTEKNVLLHGFNVTLIGIQTNLSNRCNQRCTPCTYIQICPEKKDGNKTNECNINSPITFHHHNIIAVKTLKI